VGGGGGEERGGEKKGSPPWYLGVYLRRLFDSSADGESGGRGNGGGGKGKKKGGEADRRFNFVLPPGIEWGVLKGNRGAKKKREGRKACGPGGLRLRSDGREGVKRGGEGGEKKRKGGWGQSLWSPFPEHLAWQVKQWRGVKRKKMEEKKKEGSFRFACVQSLVMRRIRKGRN